METIILAKHKQLICINLIFKKMNQCGQALGKIKYFFEKLKPGKSSKNDSKKTPKHVWEITERNVLLITIKKLCI